ncbi:Protein Hikeshi [Trichinella spiralis]|uniref:Protein Hikeshi n=1 Tax=Trichinella spiralis TaxID=6334 RepID=A0ABR3KKA9_TRISP
MFGVLVPGRAVQTNFTQIDDTHCVFSLDDAEHVNHIIVLLTGQVAFPQGYGGAVYLCYPSSDGQQAWLYLGFVSNEKPSAIFRVTKLKSMIVPQTNVPGGFVGFNKSSTVVQLGISVEPLTSITSLTPSFFNYALSFSANKADIVNKADGPYVPVNVVQGWYEQFSRRLAADPNFWKN